MIVWELIRFHYGGYLKKVSGTRLTAKDGTSSVLQVHTFLWGRYAGSTESVLGRT